MASARIVQRFTDGTEFEVEVYAEATFPDVIHEVRTQALGLWRDAFADEDVEQPETAPVAASENFARISPKPLQCHH